MADQDHNPKIMDELSGLRCPNCDYDLTGLARMQCPECGEVIDVRDLRKTMQAADESHAFFRQMARTVITLTVIAQCFQTLLFWRGSPLADLVLDSSWIAENLYPLIAIVLISGYPLLILLGILSTLGGLLYRSHIGFACGALAIILSTVSMVHFYSLILRVS